MITYVAIAFVLGGLFAAGAGVVSLMSQLRIVSQGGRASATVVGETMKLGESRRSSSGRTPRMMLHFPKLQFEDQQGTTRIIESRYGTSQRRFNVGDSVPVIYDPDEPEKMIVDRFTDKWLGAIVAFVAAVWSIGVGSVIWLLWS